MQDLSGTTPVSIQIIKNRLCSQCQIRESEKRDDFASTSPYLFFSYFISNSNIISITYNISSLFVVLLFSGQGNVSLFFVEPAKFCFIFVVDHILLIER